MTTEAKTIKKEAEGAKQQAVDYLKAQSKVDEEQVKKMAVAEVS